MCFFESMCSFYSGVKKGSVTPLGLYRKDSAEVKVVLDSEMLDNDDHLLLFHPMRNDYTMGMTAREFKQFLSFAGHEYNTKVFQHTDQ